MSRCLSRLLRALTLLLALPVAACGYLIFEERAGQPPGDRLDWGIVALDALGLLFGVIPGIVAFAVDFSTGCIYLPPDAAGYGRAALSQPPAGVPPGWVPVITVSPFAGDDEIVTALTRYLNETGHLPTAAEVVQISWQAGAVPPVEFPRRPL